MLRKTVLLALTTGYAWVVWRMTLTPQVFTASEVALVERLVGAASRLTGGTWLTYDRAEFLANVAMFVPVGALAALWLPRRAWVLAVLLGVGLSTGIELAQHTWLPGRVADPRDVLSNGLGALCGATLAGLVRTLAPAPRRRSGRRPRMV